MAPVDLFADERAFLDAYDADRFARPSLAVDVVLLTVREGALFVRLIQRPKHPFAGMWTLPGGFVAMDEGLEQAAERVLATKAGLQRVFLEQLHAFGAPERDPRTRIVSVAHIALIASERAPIDGGLWGRVVVPWLGREGGEVGVYAADAPIALGFDHASIIGAAVLRLRRRVASSALGFQLLPETFTLRRLQEVHEVILGAATNKDSFRRKVLSSGELVATGDREEAVGHRPAELYRFVHQQAL